MFTITRHRVHEFSGFVAFARGASLIAIGLAWSVIAFAQAAPPACAIKSDDLAKVFGVAFEAGAAEPSIGTGCRYRTKGGSAKNNTDFSVVLGIVKPSGPAPAFRKLMGGPGNQYLDIAGDPDRAVWVKHGAGVPSFPNISYERAGLLIELHITGIGHDADANARAARVESMNQRLLKLPRVP